MSDKPTILEISSLTTVVGGESGLLRGARPSVRAVDDVTLSVRSGEIFGIVGESGCGKSTLGRTVLGVLREAAGDIRFEGEIVSGFAARRARAVRRGIQYVHQDAAASLDPWWSIGRTVAEPLAINGMGDEAATRVDEIMTAVGLDPSMKRRYPHQLSGGQLRRVALARILILSPKLVILDEPTSGLDVSVQATVLSLLRDLRDRLNLTYIFISHDLSVVRLMCDRVAIMYLGKIVEQAAAAEIFAAPKHPYTRALLAAAPRLVASTSLQDAAIGGEPPSPTAIPSGCAFRTRCAHAEPACGERVPALEDVPTAVGGDHLVACRRWREVAREDGQARADR